MKKLLTVLFMLILLAFTLNAQTILTVDLHIAGTGGAITITNNKGTLQMTVIDVEPSNATNQTVNWSVINGTGTATISYSGLLTAYTNGTVTVWARANDGSGAYDFKQITLSNQTGPALTDVSSVIQFVINKNPNIITNVKGINGIKYYNNIFYSTKAIADNPSGTGIIDVNQTSDTTQITAGVKIYNNIFYTVNQIPNIRLIDNNSLVGFESDYNIFYCEAGTPIFTYLGTQKTFAQWQALGYDTHSIIANPKFK